MREISASLFNQIVALLTPLLESERSRHALLDQALGVNDRARALKGQLDFSGSTGEFVPHLVRELIEYGTLTSGEPALVAVLNAAKAKVGTDKAKS
jgi:hypothetical protein